MFNLLSLVNIFTLQKTLIFMLCFTSLSLVTHGNELDNDLYELQNDVQRFEDQIGNTHRALASRKNSDDQLDCDGKLTERYQDRCDEIGELNKQDRKSLEEKNKQLISIQQKIAYTQKKMVQAKRVRKAKLAKQRIYKKKVLKVKKRKSKKKIITFTNNNLKLEIPSFVTQAISKQKILPATTSILNIVMLLILLIVIFMIGRLAWLRVRKYRDHRLGCYKVGDNIAGKYKVVRAPLSGSHAYVYECKTVDEISCAIKLYKKNQIAFSKEFQSLRDLDHHNIVKIHRRGKACSLPYYEMSYVNGGTLDTLITKVGKKGKRIPEVIIVNILTSVATALRTAYAKGVFHQDICPKNIMIHYDSNKDATVKLIDFSVTGERNDKGMTGKYRYLHPSVTNTRNELRSDLYSLLLVIYRMVNLQDYRVNENMWGKDRLAIESTDDTVQLVADANRRDISSRFQTFFIDTRRFCLGKSGTSDAAKNEAVRYYDHNICQFFKNNNAASEWKNIYNEQFNSWDDIEEVSIECNDDPTRR